ncbi:hypothetical protein GPALN_006269 [Globodera pallida]|nr:hypothetical protein GPALN_006269 [Globodera pallida]
MDLPPSKLSSAASRLWGESTGQFQKKTDVKIDLGLHQKIQSNGSEEKASTSAISDGFVFGSRVFERVTSGKSDNSSSESSDSRSRVDRKPMDVSSIFKQMAKSTETGADTANMWKSTFPTSISNGSGGITVENSLTMGGLGESAKELARKCSQAGELAADASEAELEKIKTGEEDELNLLHISCRFYQYNGETKVWQERGMGSLKINQHIDARDDVRLVGRQSGNQRVLINSKIFPEMILEELSEKRLKISAHISESELPQLFLIQASPGSIGNLYGMLQKYIDASNMAKATQQLHLRKRRLGDGGGGGETTENGTGDEDDDSVEEEGTKKFAHDEEDAKKTKEEEGEERKDDGGGSERHSKTKKRRSVSGREEEGVEQQ